MEGAKLTGETFHSFYCDDVGSTGSSEAHSWKEFKEETFPEDNHLAIHHDYSYLVRFDLEKQEDAEECTLKLYYLMQERGTLQPVSVSGITREDLKEIEEYLAQSWRYMQGLWTEFSGLAQVDGRGNPLSDEELGK